MKEFIVDMHTSKEVVADERKEKGCKEEVETRKCLENVHGQAVTR